MIKRDRAVRCVSSVFTNRWPRIGQGYSRLDCTDADCVEADSVESVSHAVRLNTVVQIEMSNIEGRNNTGEAEEMVICYP